jgi:hypothetical protein
VAVLGALANLLRRESRSHLIPRTTRPHDGISVRAEAFLGLHAPPGACCR